MTLGCVLTAALAWGVADQEPASAVRPVLRLDSQPGDFILGPYLEVLEDPEGSLGVEQVAAPPLAGRFRPLGGEVLNFGLSRSAFWLRFTLATPADPAGSVPANFWVLDFGRDFFHSLTLYAPRAGGGWVAQESADPWRPLEASQSGVSLRSLHLPAPAPGQRATYYIRLKSGMALILPLAVQTARAYLEQVKTRLLAMGTYLGILGAMAVYNLFLFLTLGDKSYLWYVCHTVCYGVYFSCLGTLTNTYLPSIELIQGPDLLFGSILAALAFSCLFARAYLLTRTNNPGWDKALLAAAVATGCLALVNPWFSLGARNQAMTVLGMAMPVLVLGAGVASWRAGYRPARFLLLAWGVYGLGGMIYALTFRGILPYTQTGYYGLQIASALETVLLSLGLADRIRNLRRVQKNLEHKATTDALTGLYNASYFRERLDSEMRLARQTGNDLALIIMDVDDFKVYNDSHGHPAGDKVLAALGGVIRNSLRGDDRGCRYGGEEFAIILPGANRDQAAVVAERVRSLFGGIVFRPRPGEAVRVSVCAGVAQARPGESPDDLLARADRALYRAKADGKNLTRVGA